MDYDLIIFGFNEFGLALSYEMSKYNLKIAVIDDNAKSRSYLNRDSIVIYNYPSKINDKILSNYCYDLINELSNKFGIRKEKRNFKFLSKDKSLLLEDSIIVNPNDIIDVFYREACNNSVDFILDDGFTEFSKKENSFYILGNNNNLSSDILIHVRSFKNYKYILTTYSTKLLFEKYFEDLIYIYEYDCEIVFYKNFMGYIKIDIIQEINSSINHIEVIKKSIPIDCSHIVVSQVEYLRYSFLDEVKLDELMLNKNYFMLNSSLYFARKVCDDLLKSRSFDLRSNFNEEKKENVKEELFNNILCGCYMLSEGDIVSFLNQSPRTYKLSELLCKFGCKFSDCIDCYDKIANVIIKYTGKSINEIFDENVVKVKKFNEI